MHLGQAGARFHDPVHYAPSSRAFKATLTQTSTNFPLDWHPISPEHLPRDPSVRPVNATLHFPPQSDLGSFSSL